MRRRIGIDLGGTKIEGVLLDPQGDVVRRQRLATEAGRGYDHIVERCAGLVEELAAAGSGPLSVGVGAPGAVSAVTGMLKNSNTQCLNGHDLRGDLERRLGRAVAMDNDANCFALAEALHGAGRGSRIVFGVIMGTGVGGGIVLDGRIHRGPQDIAGEWGHHSIDPDGPDCYCGQRGCVETFLSGPGLSAAYQRRSGRMLDGSAIVAAAVSGDDSAAAVFDVYLERFGRALANVINILDPDAVVLGGGMSNIDALYGRGVERVAACVFSDELVTPIRRHQLGDSAGVIGAAILGGGT